MSTIKYTIFETKWGYFGLVSIENALIRTVLPLASREKAKNRLLRNISAADYDSHLFSHLQKQIIAYFEGGYVNFDTNTPLMLAGFGKFGASILTACRDITFAQTISYRQLACKAGHPNAARAAGSIMAKNPIPLIIPCHRVLRSDGSMGGFSAQGGVTLKKRLLTLEKQTT
ncbi:MAG: methylated-DNA--[protein]-cysteine S-methyltransferase [Planctomycetota bacterium]|nr:methylated-DNA--[protein]-cysteine S-methyltransferase [Planctomycetota bacterium]